MSRLYLTIDDGPSERFTDLVDFLKSRRVPALFFNRGDMMETRPGAVIYGIQRGFTMANHAYSHRRASKLGFDEMCHEILRTEMILKDIYNNAGILRGKKYFRFPYLDRGMGAAFVEPGSGATDHLAAQRDLLDSGLGHKPLEEVRPENIQKKRKLQNFLNDEGFAPSPFEGVTLPWYAQTEMSEAVDCLGTYSTSDWAVSQRHSGQHGFETLKDLKAKIDNDRWLKDQSSAHIVIAHDQAEIHAVTCELIDYFREQGFEFGDGWSG